MLHKGQIGATIRLTSTFDLSLATAQTIRYTKPSGAKGTWIAAINGTTNVEYVTTDADDLDESGRWTFQGFASFSDGNTVISKQVTDNIGEVIVP